MFKNDVTPTLNPADSVNTSIHEKKNNSFDEAVMPFYSSLLLHVFKLFYIDSC